MKIAIFNVICLLAFVAVGKSEVVDGLEWEYTTTNGQATVVKVIGSIVGDISIPDELQGCPVTGVGDYVFDGCELLTNVKMPSTIESIGRSAFRGCSSLTNVNMSTNLSFIGIEAFRGCQSLTTVIIPPKVDFLGGTFVACRNLTDVYFQSDNGPNKCDAYGSYFSVFEGCNWDMIIHVPATWKGRGNTLCGYTVVRDGDQFGMRTVNLTVTNIVVHYVQTSECLSMSVPITNGVGFVNVLTEIKGGNVAIPESWVSNYESFRTKFGNDFSAALTKKTGKKDAVGNPMYVWQDYVAGTDPTDEASLFRASVTIVDGKPIVSYSPELNVEEKAKRKYTVWGKIRLQDVNWAEVPSGSEADYNFFKVTVEMM